MDRTLVFCEECRKDVNYIISKKIMSGAIKGTAYQYTGKEARCANCNAFVYVPEINDTNLKALYDAYRQSNDIIPLKTIQTIPEKYAIGKRPLSLLLGWGEQTFSRYYDGDIPSKQYSDILVRIYNEPSYYTEILEKGKENLKSHSTYEKSKKAVNALLDPHDGNNAKIDLAIKYLLNQCEDITPLALQKALYYIQGFYYAFYRTYLFRENCEAWVHGPVYRDVFYRYRDYRFDPISPNDSFDESTLATSEKAIIDSVASHLCCYSGKILERFTHNEAPWLNARGDLSILTPSERIISQDSIGQYFTTVKEKYNMVTPRDIRAYAQDMFQSL